MALDRWIALVFVALCCVYGYAAFMTMDHLLPPFMQRNPVWPSTFPKVLSILGIITGLVVLFGLEPKDPKAEENEKIIDYTRLGDYHIGQALSLLGLMLLYAFLLRPAGFLAATFIFLVGGAMILGERRFVVLLPVAAAAAFVVWYLVQEVLGIFLTPLPAFL
jgi:putative tricarboxylic transport membrane protein